MKEKVTKLILNNLLVKGSILVFIGSTIANLCNFIFHVLMGRFLGPIDYGLLETLISLLGIITIPLSMVNLSVIKFVSQNNNLMSNSKFINNILNKTLKYGLLLFIIFILSSPILKNFLKINNYWLFIGVGISYYISIIGLIFNSSLQGLQKFTHFSIITALPSLSKLIIGLIIVFLGFKVGGVVFALILSTLIYSALSYKFTKKYINVSFVGVNNKTDFSSSLEKFAISSLFFTLSTTSLITVDIVLARAFLSPVNAGLYSALSVISKIIYFASGPIISVMFPIISSKFVNRENYQKVFKLSTIIVLLLSAFIGLIFSIYSKFIMKFVFGPNYLEASRFLSYFCIFISLYSLSYLLISFFLSISKIKVVILPVIAAFMQIILLIIFRNGIKQMIYINITVLSLLFLSLLVYYWHEIKNGNIISNRTCLQTTKNNC